MQVVLKEAVHGGALGLLGPGTVDVPDSLAFELVATKRATWPGSRPNAWPDQGGAVTFTAAEDAALTSLVSGAGMAGAVVGDSLAVAGMVVNATQIQYTARSPVAWALAMDSNRFTLVLNSGVGGETAGDGGADPYASGGLARVRALLAPYNGQLAFVEFHYGTNDLNSQAAEIIFRNIKLLAAEAWAIGAQAIVRTPPPAEIDATVWNKDDTRRARWGALCRLIRNWCAVTPRAKCADDAAVLADPTQVTCIPQSAYAMTTFVHPKARANQRMAIQRAAIYAAIGGPPKRYPTHSAETWAFDSTSNNIAPVARCTASGGTASTGVTGVVSAGLIATRPSGSGVTAVAATVPRRVQDATAWAAAAATTVGMVRRPTTVDLAKPYLYVATAVAGTPVTGGAEPTWPTTPGATVIDNAGANQVTWTCVQVSTDVNERIGFWQALFITGAGTYETMTLVAYFGAGSGGTAGKVGWAVGQTITTEAEVWMQAPSGVIGLWTDVKGMLNAAGASLAVSGLNLTETAESDFEQAAFRGVVPTPAAVIQPTMIPGTTAMYWAANVRLSSTGKAILLVDSFSFLLT